MAVGSRLLCHVSDINACTKVKQIQAHSCRPFNLQTELTFARNPTHVLSSRCPVYVERFPDNMRETLSLSLSFTLYLHWALTRRKHERIARFATQSMIWSQIVRGRFVYVFGNDWSSPREIFRDCFISLLRSKWRFRNGLIFTRGYSFPNDDSILKPKRVIWIFITQERQGEGEGEGPRGSRLLLCCETRLNNRHIRCLIRMLNASIYIVCLLVFSARSTSTEMNTLEVSNTLLSDRIRRIWLWAMRYTSVTDLIFDDRCDCSCQTTVKMHRTLWRDRHHILK